MQHFYKIIRPVLLAACGLVLALCAAALCAQPASAATAAEGDWFYRQLSPEAKRFYGAIGEMEKQGLLKEGNAEYDLLADGTLTEAQLASYSSNADVLVAFGAARDAYSLDHPDLFYVDFSYLSVSVGTKNGEPFATLGTGRGDSYYLQNGFESAAQTEAAIAEYEEALGNIVSGAREKSTVEEQIAYVNGRIVERAEYDFCATADESGTVYTADAPFIRTAYGALVRGKSVCEGYARAFKSAMDRLNVPCVLVQGYAQSDAGLEPHMWNYVQVEGAWYGVDVTWNDGENCSPEGYLLLGNAQMKREHNPDGVVSEANFEFRYPALNPYRLGVTQDENGLVVRGEYDEYTNGGERVPYLVLNVSYDGKNAAQVTEQYGLYLAYRFYGDESWTDWCLVCQTTGAVDMENYTQFNGANSYVQYVQFALIDYAPDSDFIPGGSNMLVYNPENLTAQHMKNVSEPFGNAAYGTYAAPPYVTHLSPEGSAPLNAEQTYRVTAVFSEELVLADGSKEAGLRVVSQHDGIENYVKITDFKWSADSPNTLSFTFCPSQMFEHNNEVYSLYPVNLVGKESGKAPNPITYVAAREKYVCNKIYGDGRLYMKIYGQPSIVATEDLSLKGWRDEEGNIVSENQRSQLMLVATRPSEVQSDAMLNGAAESAGVKREDILSSQTYELDLQLCGMFQTIPAGSFMQLSFGFPEGYGPDDAGVTFKVYHYKKDAQGNIDLSLTEELDCVVTPYGLVVTVTDFSPFAVVALNEERAATEKAVFAQTVGAGGKLQGGGIIKVAEGGSASYTLLPEAGYAVDRATLNGREIAVQNNQITLAYAQLEKNNVLEVSFVSERVAAREEAEGITVVRPSAQVVDPMGSISVSLSAEIRSAAQDAEGVQIVVSLADGRELSVGQGGALLLMATAEKRNALVSGNISYEWYKNGALIVGESGETLSVQNFSVQDAGSYTVKAVFTYGDRVQTAVSEAVGISVSGDKPASSGDHLGLIIGIFAAVILLVVALAIAFLFVARKRRAEK